MKNNTAKKYTATVIRFRWWFLSLIGLFLLFCSFGIPKLYFDSSMNAFLIEDDPARIGYDRFLETFEAHEYVVILADAPTPWNADYIKKIVKLNDQLAALPHVKRVASIVNVEHITGIDDDLVVGEFISSAALDAKTLAEKRSYALNNKIYRTAFVNGDGSKLSFLIETNILTGELDYKRGLTHGIQQLGKLPEFQDLHLRMAGTSVMETLLQEITLREAAIFGTLVFILLMVGFYIVFRSVLGVVLPLGIASLSIFSIFGLMGLTDTPMSIMTAIVPSFLLSVGVASCVYLLTQIYSNIARGDSVLQAMEEAMSMAAMTCLLSALTTAGALLTFSSSDVKVVQQLGITIGVGLLISVFFTLILIPIAFSFVKTIKASDKRNQIILARVGILEKISDIVALYYRLIIVMFVVLGAFALWGLSQLKVDFYYLGMFKPESSVYQANTEIDREFGTTSSIEIELRGKHAGDIKDPAVLHLIEQIAASVEHFRDVSVRSYSVVDLVKQINQVLHQGDASYYRIPETREAIAQYLLLFEMGGGTELKRLTADDFAAARLTLYIPNMTNQQNRDLVDFLHDQVDSAIKSSPSPVVRNLDVEVTGIMVLWETINSYLAQSQIKSMFLAMAVVCVVMVIVSRSLVLGITMTLCNTFVVVAVLGFIGWRGIPLDPYLILIGAIALGILDDDTIHFIKHFQHEFALHGCAKIAIKNTFRSSGQAIFYTTAIVTLSFLAYTLSEMKSLNNFGLVTAITVAFGMIVEFFLTPSILLLLYQRQTKDVVDVEPVLPG